MNTANIMYCLAHLWSCASCGARYKAATQQRNHLLALLNIGVVLYLLSAVYIVCLYGACRPWGRVPGAGEQTALAQRGHKRSFLASCLQV